MSSIFTVPELAIGVGLSEAASAAFEPKVEVPKQTAWAANPQRLPDVGLIAALVAGGKVTQQDGRAMAARLGFNTGPFDSLTWLAQNRLDFALMLRLWRRFGAFDQGADATLSALLDETLAHEQLDWNYQPWLKALKTAELVGLGDIGYGVVRGMLPAPSWVPVAPPTSGDYVPRFPQVALDPVKLAAALGFDENMLRLMVGRSGLSMAPIMAANALFRSNAAAEISALPNVPGVAAYTVKPYVGPNDYLLAIAEGDLRTEWADAVRETARQILTTGEYAELELRGFIDKPTRRALTAQHGMSHFDSDLLYDVKGRAPAVHAITTGLARGAQYPGDYAMVPEPYRSAIQRSDIRPEFADIVYHDRYSYPSAFVLRALAQAGDLGDQQAVEQVLLEIGWKPSFATQVSTAWTQGNATGDPHVAKAQNQLWTTAHRSYVGEMIDAATATAAIETAGVAAASAPAVINLWSHERGLIRKQLTPAQVKKAYKDGLYTLAQAETALLARGYDQADATTLLNE
jgi:hypothetical protein